MKVEDKIVEILSRPVRKVPSLGSIKSLMITHERPGLLLSTVQSYLSKAKDVPLVVFDDGSTSEEKKRELDTVQDLGVEVVRFSHSGFAETWLRILTHQKDGKYDGYVLLEDDLSFAVGWMDVLRRMYEGYDR